MCSYLDFTRSHSLESVVSLPLQAVQVALLALALSSVAMFVFWRQLSSAGVWLVYTAGGKGRGGEGRGGEGRGGEGGEGVGRGGDRTGGEGRDKRVREIGRGRGWEEMKRGDTEGKGEHSSHT